MLNQCQFIGNLGADPDVRSMQSGDEVCNLSLAVTEKWKDKSGERKEKTEWVRVVIFSQGLVKVAKSYLSKGSKIYVSGKMQTRSWEQDGQKKYTTEIVLQGFDAKLVMLDGKKDNSAENPYQEQNKYNDPHPTANDEFEDEIPF